MVDRVLRIRVRRAPPYFACICNYSSTIKVNKGKKALNAATIPYPQMYCNLPAIIADYFGLKNINNLNGQKMKKFVLFAFLVIFSLKAYTIAPDSKIKSENHAVPDKKEYKMSEDEANRLTTRVEEIRNMDKSKMTTKEKRELRKELRGINEKVHKDGGYIYISAGTAVFILILVIIFL